MSAGFTPAPWAIQKPNSNDSRRIIAPNQSGFDVCRLVRSANDAHLIAAAPELYEALEATRKAFCEVHFNEAQLAAYNAGSLAIRKARGETVK